MQVRGRAVAPIDAASGLHCDAVMAHHDHSFRFVHAVALVSLGAAACSRGDRDVREAAVPRPPTIAEQEERLGPGDEYSDRLRVLAAPRDPVYGPAGAAMELVAFVDLDAETLEALEASVPALRGEPGDLRVVIKLKAGVEAPLGVAGRAAAAAAAQDRFWPYLRCLAGRRGQPDAVLACAGELGLDQARFSADLVAPWSGEYVEETEAYAQRLEVLQPPVVFLNGFRAEGLRAIRELDKGVTRERANVAALADRLGIAPADVVERIKRDGRTGPVVRRYLDPEARYQVEVTAAEPSLGPADAPVTIVVFSRFDCPYCADADRMLRAVAQARGDVRLVFRHFPQSPDAAVVHMASAAAHRDGQFWRSADVLFELEGVATADVLVERLAGLGLDPERAAAELASRRDAPAVRRDLMYGTRLGVTATPTLFVNGTPVVGLPEPAELDEILDREAARAASLIAGGVAPGDVYAAAVAGGQTEGLVDPPAEDGEAQTEPAPGVSHQLPVAGSPVAGDGDAARTITVFTDFTCHDCAAIAGTLDALVAAGGVRVVYKLTPREDPPHARTAARIAHAAAARGRFGRAAAGLYEIGEQVDAAAIAALARELGVAPAIDDHGWDATIDRDLELATRIGVDALPAVFVDGVFAGNDAAALEAALAAR
jgi:protein-disulfide isomerase